MSGYFGFLEEWGLDFQPNKAIWDDIDKKSRQWQDIPNDDESFTVGSIYYPGLLRYAYQQNAWCAPTALERRARIKDCQEFIAYMKKVEENYKL